MDRANVTRFALPTSFLDRYEVNQVGDSTHKELWVAAEELEEFNDNIVGPIEVVARFGTDETH